MKRKHSGCPTRRVDLTGKVCGKLKIIRDVGLRDGGSRIWLSICECGAEDIRQSEALVQAMKVGYISRCKSCRSVQVAKIGYSNTTHGATVGRVVGKRESRLYSCWVAMKDRCGNPNNQAYKNYGAKAIKVCDGWETFEGFRSWALENGYADYLTIERIDPDRNYSPENCEWITKSENSRRAMMVRWHGFGRGSVAG